MKNPALREAIIEKLREELALQLKAAELAREEAISEESRARSKYDTHSQEAAYLAQGQARLAAEVDESIKQYAALELPELGPDSPIVIGALVQLESAGKRSWYLLGPRAGGLELSWDDREILVLTPQSPLGRELVGKRVGEMVRTPGRAGTLVTHTIVAVE